jgi:hypothetical protein
MGSGLTSAGGYELKISVDIDELFSFKLSLYHVLHIDFRQHGLSIDPGELRAK